MEKCYFCKGTMVKKKIKHLHKFYLKILMLKYANNAERYICRQKH